MNRRELLQIMSAVSTGLCGIEATAEIVDTEPRPLLVVIRAKRPISQEAAECLRKSWDRLRELHPEVPPACVLPPDIEIEIKRQPA